MLVSVEGGARLFLEPPSLAAGGPLGWTARPDLVEHEVLAGVVPFSVSTNEHGLRTDLTPARGETERWVTFGDSTVFGWGLAPEDTPAGVLEELVPGVEVLNAGQPGYSSEQSRRLAELVVPAYQPDRVIWFHSWHDVRPAVPDRDHLPDRPVLLQQLLGWSAVWQHLTRPPSRDNPIFAFKAEDSAQAERVPQAHREDNLARLVEACGDVEMVIVLMPDEGLGATPLADELAVVEGARFIDLSRVEVPLTRDRITLPRDPTHLNARGNRLYMELLVAELQP
ncbi:MAG: SGNH/GDSL hydrolase family protein [Proteobacteria bacterium]|nr:SGNH/GDSL hydrolase family protein [Pseudomonadota bacterium]MCP4917316.1 SGNH/GDSL hydrolase family protein [Pseudomonadota bacterium]